MKKSWLIILALTLVTAMFAYEVIAWQEDFEGDISGWTHYDGNDSPNNWHIHNYGGAQGDVWWMGDPDLASGTNIGGYLSHQYLVLDTPARTLTAANATLTFKMLLGLEDPGQHEAYNVWDSANIRVSIDGGNTWTVISGTPAYSGTSSYAFGYEHGEGVNVPAWGGMMTTWVNASFNLSAYVGQSVKIRFAFASDPAYDTTNNPALFGMMVDDISFGGYTNNGTDDGQMTWQSLVPLGGDIWFLGTDAGAPSPTHVMKCQNAQGTYNVNMLNYLVSPPIQLPTSGEIRADFMIRGSFSDNDAFPNVDFFGWEITPDNGISWFYMSNPYGDPTGSNYVYSDAPSTWASMTASYSLDGYIDDYAGQTIRLRWMFQSDDDQPVGEGIMIDDVKIYNEVFIAAPENLVTTVDGANVVLTWETPGGGGGGGEEGWLHYDGEYSNNSIGTGDIADFDVAAKWDAAGDYGINPWVGMAITKIQFYPHESNCQYAVRIWTGGAGTLAYEQAVTPIIDQWNEVVLTDPWVIPSGISIMAGYRCNTQTGYPAGCDAGPAIDGYGNMIRLGGSWSTLYSQSESLNYNWNIRVYVADAAGREYEMTSLPINEQSHLGELAVHQSSRDNRDVSAYKIYRNQVQIDEVPGNVLTYTDMNVEPGLYVYHLTAMYGDHESTASNNAIAFIMPSMHTEIANDDGTAEQGYNVGQSLQMAAKYSYNDQVTVIYAKIYVHTVNQAGIIIRIYDDDGPGGMPQTQLAQHQYPASNVVAGWNYIALPNIVVPDGQFYLAILEVANSSQIGLDTSSNGNSFTFNGNIWNPLDIGELMIRAIVEYGVDNDDPITPVFTLDASNYPNPFNPETTIAYSVPSSGPTTLKIYNLKGQVVRTLVSDIRTAGNHKVVWNGKDDNGASVASGMYFYRVSNAGKNITRKMLLAK